MADDTSRYTVAWISPLPSEFIVAKAVLDEDYGSFYTSIDDRCYFYHGGRVAKHDVLLALQPTMGDECTRSVWERVIETFQNIEHVLVVGTDIGYRDYTISGVQVQVTLGDVVVAFVHNSDSWEREESRKREEIWKSGRMTEGMLGTKVQRIMKIDGNAGAKDSGVKKFTTKIVYKATDAVLKKSDRQHGPISSLLETVDVLSSQHENCWSSEMPTTLKEIWTNMPENMRQQHDYLGSSLDKLFLDDCAHDSTDGVKCETCCDWGQTCKGQFREVGTKRMQHTPKVHYENMVRKSYLWERLKTTMTRERYRLPRYHRILHMQSRPGIFCDIRWMISNDEAETNFTYLEVRGIRDYTDAHNNFKWSPYAAATAAAYTKQLLRNLPASTAASISHQSNKLFISTSKNSKQITLRKISSRICPYCQNLHDEWGKEFPNSIWLFARKVSLAVMEFHHESDVYPSGGCCVLINAMKTVFPDAALYPNQFVINTFPDCMMEAATPNSLPRAKLFSVDLPHSDWKDNSSKLFKLFVTEGRFNPCLFSIELSAAKQYTVPFHPIWSTIPASEGHTDLTSDKSLSFVRSVLQDCQESHKACTLDSDHGTFMPKRLLDMGTIDHKSTQSLNEMPVRLVETGQHMHYKQYMTLSHRWGAPGSNITTQHKTLEKYKQGIAFGELGTIY
jgi:hypothetical protein